MKIFKLVLVALVIHYGRDLTGQETMKKSNIESSIDKLFENFEDGIFQQDKELHEESGWIMYMGSGKELSRSFLMSQANTVISYGKEAVPCLFKWVMNDSLFIRYIAIYSLQQLTGLSPFIPYFDQEDMDGNRQKAIKIWSDWWEDQRNSK